MEKTTTLLIVFIAVVFLQGCNYFSAWLMPIGMNTNTDMQLPRGHAKIKPTDKVYIVDISEKGGLQGYYDHATTPDKPVSDISALKNVLIDGENKYKKDFVVIIKASKRSEYKEILNVLDIMVINKIPRYSLEEN